MKLATAVSLGASVFGLGSDAATQQSIDPSEITEDLAYSTLRQMGSCVSLPLMEHTKTMHHKS